MGPVGVTIQDPEPTQRLDPETGARWMTNYLKALTMELTALARARGKSEVHNLEPGHRAGTNWIPGHRAGSGARGRPA
jgi:glutamate synthase domain-containing protein 2